jgi:hypothetical protein
MIPTPVTGEPSRTRRRQLALSPEHALTIVAWRDELVEKHPDSIATHSDEMLVWWTPILGPSATLMAHHLALLTRNGGTHTFAQPELAQTFGLGVTSGRLHAVLERLHRFGVTHVEDHTIAVRLAMPPMSVRFQRQLPGYLALAYQNRP